MGIEDSTPFAYCGRDPKPEEEEIEKREQLLTSQLHKTDLLEKELLDARNEIKNMLQQYAIIKQENDAKYTTLHDQYQTECEHKSKAKDTLSSSKSDYEEQIKRIREAHQKIIESNHKQYQNESQRNAQLMNQITGHKTTIDTLQKQINEGNMKALQPTQHETENMKLQQEIETLYDRIKTNDSLSHDVKSKSDEIDALILKTDLEKAIEFGKSLKSQLVTITKKLKENGEQNIAFQKEKRDEIEKMQKYIQQLHKEKRDLEQKHKQNIEPLNQKLNPKMKDINDSNNNNVIYQVNNNRNTCTQRNNPWQTAEHDALYKKTAAEMIWDINENDVDSDDTDEWKKKSVMKQATNTKSMIHYNEVSSDKQMKSVFEESSSSDGSFKENNQRLTVDISNAKNHDVSGYVNLNRM